MNRCLYLVLLAALTLGLSIPIVVYADDNTGTWTFNSNVDAVCTVTVDPHTPGDPTSASITLPTISLADLEKPGPIYKNVHGLTPFTITATGCGAGASNVAIDFNDPADPNVNAFYKNQTGTAQGVALAIVADDQYVGPSSPEQIPYTNGQAKEKFFVGYALNTQHLTSGTVKADLVFTVSPQ